VVSRKNKRWGEYVDVRINAPELLEKEITVKNPKTVLLGSTTECFQPIEKKCRVTERILEILNKHKIHYVILTRSPHILDYIHLLKEGFCKEIYFTINKFNIEFKERLEPKSPPLNLRTEAVNLLLEEGLPVVPYFSPLLPWVSDIKDVFLRFAKAPAVEFECLNFRLNNINEIIDTIASVDLSLRPKYERMLNDRVFYALTWRDIKDEIMQQAKEVKKGYNIYIHDFGKYFKNTYS
jgi:DNA repair photolyase